MKNIKSCLLTAAFVCGTLMLSSCAWRPKLNLVDGISATTFQPLITDRQNNPQPLVLGNAGITVTYLGSGGFLFERGDDVILTGPFLSYHWYLRLGLWRVHSDEKLLNSVLRPKSTSLAKAEAVLIGHGHYDHLLDIPYIMQTFCPSATVYAAHRSSHHLHRCVYPSSRKQVPRNASPNPQAQAFPVGPLGEFFPALV